MINVKAFDYYEKRFAQAMIDLPDWNPLNADEKKAIRNIVKKCLGIEESWIPRIKPNVVKCIEKEKYKIECLTFSSWDGVGGSAHLYIPNKSESPKPLVLLCCGHGPNGKLNPGYQAMAARLARQGALVLVPDNIGQGEREAMGHSHVLLPFACGISLQGLIVMETLGLLDWAENDARVDRAKIAAIGNSGGGTLALFLGALSEKLSVLSSSGYPSTFDFIAQKEKRFCSCNILPHIVGQVEMWHLLGCFAPKPLFIFQGRDDNLFPMDIFHKVSRKVSNVYKDASAKDKFSFGLFEGEHPWDNKRRFALGDFISKHLAIAPAEKLEDDLFDTLDVDETCFEKWPDELLTTDELAKRLTGKNPPDDIQLHEIFPPAVAYDIDEQTAIRQNDAVILSQFEAFLTR